MSGYDRERVHVQPRCDCDRYQCRYLCFLELCSSGRYLFQICNHNLLLADALHREAGRPAILPEHRILIIDEAHLLPDSAAQMLGTAITEEELRELICQLKKERYVLAAERLEECTDNLLSALEKEEYSFKDCYLQISQAEHLLHVIKKQLAGRLSPPARQQLNALTDSMEPLWSALLRGGGPPGMTTNITACSICPDTRPSCLTIATAMFSLPT